MFKEKNPEFSNQEVGQNPELIYLGKKKIILEKEKLEELRPFFVAINEINKGKGKSERTGYTIKNYWGGYAVKKGDLKTVELIEKKYEDELRKVEQRIEEIDQLNGNGSEVDDKTDYLHDQKKKERELIKNSSKLINLVSQAAKNSHDKLGENTPIKKEIPLEPEANKENGREITIDELAEILKNHKIDQIIVAGSYNRNKELARFNPDLDSKGALYLLNSLNKKPASQVYNEGSTSSVVGKRGEGKDPVLKDKKELKPLIINKNGIKEESEDKKTTENNSGLKIFLDTGGKWLKLEENGEEKILYIDHHGSGKRSATSGTKMMYDAMEKAGILENKPWVKKLVRFINDTDNLNYIDEKDKFGKRIFTETNFKLNWPRSLYALAEDYIPFNKLVELFENGTIKDSTKPFTKDELNGEIGKIEVIVKGQEKSLKDVVEEIENKAAEIVESVKRSRNFSKEKKLNLNSKNLGKIIYHNFKCKYKDKEGKVHTNIIDDKMAFKAIKAMNADTYVVWNNAKDKKTFNINSTNVDLVELEKRLNEADPGCAKEVRGVFIFGKINNLTESQFLNILDPEILKKPNRKDKLKDEKNKLNNEPEKQNDNTTIAVEPKNENEIQREKAIDELKNEIDRLIKEKNEKIEAIRAKYKNS